MYIYILIFIVIMCLFALERAAEVKCGAYYQTSRTVANRSIMSYNKKAFRFLIIILLFISGYRADNIGTDHKTYIAAFNHIKTYGNAYFREKGYVLLNKLVIFLGGNTTTLCFLVSFMLCIGFYFYVVKYVRADYFLFSLIIFVCQPYMYIQSTFNIMRQGCAIAIVLLSIPFLLNKKWLMFSAIILLASTFHTSALVMLFLIIFRNIKFDVKKIRLVASACILMNFAGAGIWPFKIADRLMGVYRRYSTYEASLLNFKPYVIAIFIVVLYFTNIYCELYQNKTEKFFVDLFLISLSCMIFCVQSDILYRVYIYIAFLAVPGATMICKNLRKKNSVIGLCFIGYYSAFYIGYIYLWYINNNTYYYPFKFVFER